MEDEPPPVRRLVLKQRDVDPVDKVSRPGDGTAISVRLIHLENKQAADRPAGSWPSEVPQRLPDTEGTSPVFKQKEFAPIDPPSPAGDESAISVSGMLRANRAAAVNSGPELIAMPVRRKSRRHRDFIVLVSCAILAIGGLAATFRHDMQVVSLALFGIVFLTVILSWIMYGVRDRY
jgi:hypothetical protein